MDYFQNITLFKGDDMWTPLIVALDIMQISNEKLVIALQNAFFLFFRRAIGRAG